MQARPPHQQRGRAGAWRAFRNAWDGLIHTVVHQPHMRVHVISAVLVSLVGSGIPLGLAEKVTLIFCVLLIFFAEILNSALEQLVDLAIQELDEKARVTKDAAAAGVLVLATGTVVIFAALLVHNWEVVTAHTQQIQRQVVFGLPFTLSVALLLWRRPRPIVVDAGLFALAAGLLGVLWLRSTSAVFSAMALGLLVVAGAAAVEQHHPRAPVRKQE